MAVHTDCLGRKDHGKIAGWQKTVMGLVGTVVVAELGWMVVDSLLNRPVVPKVPGARLDLVGAVPSTLRYADGGHMPMFDIGAFNLGGGKECRLLAPALSGDEATISGDEATMTTIGGNPVSAYSLTVMGRLRNIDQFVVAGEIDGGQPEKVRKSFEGICERFYKSGLK